MSLLPDSATFHEKVQACFVAYRGRGLSLSAVDLELVDGWAESGAPFEVVARGIRKAAEALLWDAPEGEAWLRSLRTCRRQVDAEIQKYLKRSAGQTAADPASGPAEATPPVHVARHQKLVAAVRKATKPAVPAWLPRLPEPGDYGAADRQEALAVVLLLRALPFAERQHLTRAVRRLMENTGAMSPATRRESVRFHRAALVRQRFNIPSFW